MAQMATEDIMQLIAGGAAQDERLYVKFNTQAVQNEVKTLAEGRPIFDPVIYIRIAQPGDQTSQVHRPVTMCGGRRCLNAPTNRCDLHRFPRAYAAFMGNLDQDAASGTPLAAWPILTVSQVAELAHFRVHTIEQLAELADSAIQGIGPIQALKQQAKDFVEAARGNAPLLRMREELRDKDERLVSLENALEAQKAQIDQLIRQQHAPAAAAALPATTPVPTPAAIEQQADHEQGRGKRANR